jgi:hypothetical protein
MLERQTEYIFCENVKVYLSVRTTFVNRYRAAWHYIETHVAEPGPLLRGHLVDTVMCNRVLHCGNPKAQGSTLDASFRFSIDTYKLELI